MKYLYTRKQILEFVMNPGNHYPYEGVIDMLLLTKENEKKSSLQRVEEFNKTRTKEINVPEAHKNIEQMKKLDGDKEFVEIGKLNLNDYVDNLFDRREVSSSTLEVELAIENKINELVNRVNQLSKKK